MLIDTVRFSHLLEDDKLLDISHFLSHTAFIVSHKSESIETLLGVLWYLPVNSPIIVVTNSTEQSREDLNRAITERLAFHKNIYLIHQKDARIARFFQSHGVAHILGEDGKVRDGKGEGMYIGVLCAALLRYPKWVVFYDADNLVPCALLEYTLAMGRLFLSGQASYNRYEPLPSLLHNVRICWSSKPSMNNGTLENNLLGRCTSVISPIFRGLLSEWFGIHDYMISSSNAGEQGMSIKTAKALRFSSGFSVETFQLLDLLYRATEFHGQPGTALLQQYQSQSPHFHTKREDEHIKKMIAVSLGCFFAFQGYIPRSVEEHVRRIQDDMRLDVTSPLIYPSLQSLDLEGDESLLCHFKLFSDVNININVDADADADTDSRDTYLETTII